MGGKEPSGSMCGDRSGEVCNCTRRTSYVKETRSEQWRIFSNWFQVTLIEVTSDKEVRLMVEIQSSRWRWNIGITQVLQPSLLINALLCHGHLPTIFHFIVDFEQLDFLCPSRGAAPKNAWQHRLRKKESVNVRFSVLFLAPLTRTCSM